MAVVWWGLAGGRNDSGDEGNDSDEFDHRHLLAEEHRTQRYSDGVLHIRLAVLQFPDGETDVVMLPASK